METSWLDFKHQPPPLSVSLLSFTVGLQLQSLPDKWKTSDRPREVEMRTRVVLCCSRRRRLFWGWVLPDELYILNENIRRRDLTQPFPSVWGPLIKTRFLNCWQIWPSRDSLPSQKFDIKRLRVKLWYHHIPSIILRYYFLPRVCRWLEDYSVEVCRRTGGREVPLIPSLLSN